MDPLEADLETWLDTDPAFADAMNDLARYLVVLESPPTGDSEIGDASPKWRVEDDAAAEWAMSRLRSIARQQAGVDAVADDRVDAIESWRRRSKAPLERSAAYFDAVLTDYLARRLEAGALGRKRSIALPSGTIAARASTIVEVVLPADEAEADALLDLLDQMGLARSKVEPDKSAIKQYHAERVAALAAAAALDASALPDEDEGDPPVVVPAPLPDGVIVAEVTNLSAKPNLAG